MLEAEVRQRVPLHHPALAGDKEALLGGRDARDRILRPRHGRHEALLVVEARAGREGLVDVEHHLHPALRAADGRGGREAAVRALRPVLYAVAVHPDVDHVLGRHDRVGVRHRDVRRLDVEVLGVHRAADVVADDDDVLTAGVVGLRDQGAVLLGRADVLHVLDVLRVLLVAVRVPEDDDVLASLFLQDRVHEGLREEAPEVVRPDVREEDVGVDGDGQPQAVPLPRDGAQVVAG
mmetsp:Transcript_61083/g.160610  ORF Transcript_61083/g.160610 Transcript_61083/m.160610 type:complete len:235 (+) Transcript_61083:2050-2754(+)